ncbi:MAG: YARHG domain-containing protein [Cellulosilyticaceae bacterium]
MIEASQQEIVKLQASLEQANTSGAYESERIRIEELRQELGATLAGEDYEKALGIIKQWQDLIAMINQGSAYNLVINQVDVSEYPNIKVYLRIEDEYSQEVVNNIALDSFYLSEQIGGSVRYIEKQVQRAVQLDEVEKLNICMVADVSGSMMGDPLYTAQYVMSEFVNQVQFDIGDKLCLLSFADQVTLNQPFTSDTVGIYNAIMTMQTGNMTAFYDALYTSINHTVRESGAKCIIAFTDGADNQSKCSPQMIIELAKRYNIPIFIIGVGQGIDTRVMETMADSTGGFYRHINTIGSMSEIYQNIYRHQKELYMIEYETDQSKEEAIARNIYIQYADEQVKVRNQYTYTPAILQEGRVSNAQLFVNDYIIYDSDSRYVTVADLQQLSAEQLRIARNEIYARKGRQFVDQELQAYFNQRSWYRSSIAAEDFREEMLNDYEKANAYFIREYEVLHNMN